jgi:hypothetical protein
MDNFFNFFLQKNSASENEGGIVLNYEQLGKPFFCLLLILIPHYSKTISLKGHEVGKYGQE